MEGVDVDGKRWWMAVLFLRVMSGKLFCSTPMGSAARGYPEHALQMTDTLATRCQYGSRVTLRATGTDESTRYLGAEMKRDHRSPLRRSLGHLAKFLWEPSAPILALA